MTLNVSTSEMKAKLSSFLQRVVQEREEVVIENRGIPQAVLISCSDYEHFSVWREQERRRQALEELQELADTIRSRSSGLADEEAEELADRFSRDVIEEMIAEGKVSYDSGAE